MRKAKLFVISVGMIIMFLSGCAASDSSNGRGDADGNIVSAETDSEKMKEHGGSEAEQQSESAEKADTESSDKTSEISVTTANGDKSEASKGANQSVQATNPAGSGTTSLPNTAVGETEKNTSGVEPATKKKYVKTETENTTETVDYKYGVKKIITYVKKYNVYSDGSKELVSSSDSSKYDVSGYNATDSELKAESDSKASEYMSYYNEVLRLVNEIRAEVGAAPLTLDTTMCQAATMRAVEMNYSHKFSHTRPNESSCFSVLKFYGISYSAAGENIAAGYGNPQAVVNGWKNSEGHYKNMINSSFRKLGVGLSKEYTDGYKDYWVQLFSD